MAAKLNIVLGGYIVGYPLGGMTWHHLNYLLGLRELGHEMTYLEDGAYHPPFDPRTGDSGVADYGVAYLRRTFRQFRMEIPFHYRYGTYHAGLSIREMDDVLRRADLLICVSGVTPVQWRPLPRRSLVIDTDPVFTQLEMARKAALLDYYRSFTACATFGRLLGATGVRSAQAGDDESSALSLPRHAIDWIGTHQPVCLRYWPAEAPPDNGAFTTIGKWEQSEQRHVDFTGRRLLSSKSVEWDKVIDLPRRTLWPMELAMQGIPAAARQRYASHGWRVIDAQQASASASSFADFIRASAGEFTVAKPIYTEVASGWFSDRSACFLASGRPVVTQATGFERWLDTGRGLFSFATIEQAATALETIRRDPAGHAAAARAVAERWFDSDTVLRELLDQVM